MENQEKIAVLIDAENVSKKYVKLIMDEVSEYGIATYKRIYGDFTNPSVMSWQDKLRDFAMTPVFQFNYTKGKNASDSALIIDAMDILYSGKVTAFCLVTSDSDFTKLANRLREAGMMVIGMGEQKTPGSFVAACETFKFLDLLYQENLEEEEESRREAAARRQQQERQQNVQPPKKHSEEKSKAEPAETPENKNNIPGKDEIGAEIVSIIKSRSDENGWVNLSEIGVLLSKRVPGFDPRNYKYLKLGRLIESFDYLETNTVKNPNHRFLKVVYVRIRNK